MTKNNAINNTLHWLKLRSGAFWLRLFAPTLTENRDVTIGATGLDSLAAADKAAGRVAIDAEARSDNYVKGNYTLLAGGTLTSERWVFLPIFYDIYNRINISRAYSDDVFGGGALSALIEVCAGAWGSSGNGAFLRCAKYNEYTWTGAFAGATEHLLREIRALESSGAEVGYSGVWIRVMGGRTYKFSGLFAAPSDYATYIPTIGTSLALLLPPGMGVWEQGRNNTYSPYYGWTSPKADIADLIAAKIRSSDTAPATTTTTGPFQLPGIGMGDGRGVFAKGVAFNDSVAASQINRSLYFSNGNPVFKLGDGRDITPIPVALTAPTGTSIIVPYNATATIFSSRSAAGGILFSPDGAAGRTAGTVTSYPIVADGISAPVVNSEIVKLAGSANYDNRNNVINTFQFTWDGTTLWYQILRAEIPPLTGLTTIATNFFNNNSFFNAPGVNTYSSINSTAFSGWGSSAQTIPAGKDGQITARMGADQILSLHNNNTTPSTPAAAPNWLYYTWNGGGTLFTGESGGSPVASTITGITGLRYVQIRRVGSAITIHHKISLGDVWTLVRTMPTANSGQLFVMLGTTSTSTVEIISLEVAA